MTPRILLFDLGGVLVDLGDPVAAIGLDMTSEEFWTTWLSSPLVREFETGKLSRSEFLARFGAQLGLHDANEFERRMRGWRLPLYEDAKALLHTLLGKVEIALLSNTNEIHWQHVVSQTSLFAEFSKLFLSFETGNAKPDAAAFRDVVAHFGCVPGEIVFLDDNVHNIAAASSLGLRARQVKGPVEVRQAVREFFPATLPAQSVC